MPFSQLLCRSATESVTGVADQRRPAPMPEHKPLPAPLLNRDHPIRHHSLNVQGHGDQTRDQDPHASPPMAHIGAEQQRRRDDNDQHEPERRAPRNDLGHGPAADPAGQTKQKGGGGLLGDDLNQMSGGKKWLLVLLVLAAGVGVVYAIMQAMG